MMQWQSKFLPSVRRLAAVVLSLALLAPSFILPPAAHAAGTVYYVKQAGGDNGKSGTSWGSACKTPANPLTPVAGALYTTPNYSVGLPFEYGANCFVF